MTTTSENKNLVRRFVDAIDRHDLEAAIEVVASDLVNHAALPEAQGAPGLRLIFSKLWAAVPDQRSSCEDLIAEGDRVVCRLRVRGTQTGTFQMATLSLPATGREFSTEHIHVFRVSAGKLAEHWAGRDDFGMLRQLGHAPFTEGAR